MPAARARPGWWAAGLLLAAALLRALPLLDHRFHPDEALYAYFGRLIASGRDPLLAQTLVDKPPLFFYLLAGSFSLLGGHELAARLPTYLASLVGVALTYALARQLYGRPAARLAAGLMALSPLAILFSVTVFLDPLLTTLGLWLWWAAAAGRWRQAGLALALAVLLKQTALVFVPLALGLALIDLPAGASGRAAGGRLRRLAGPLLLGLLAAGLISLGWDAARQSWGAAIGFWDQGLADNAPNRLVRSGEVPLRALAWLDLLNYATGLPALNLALAAGVPLLLAVHARRPSRAALADWLITGYLLAYLAAYWLLAFNVWDRYLVPILPLLLILAARAATQLTERLGAVVARRWPAGRPLLRCALPLALAASLLHPALTAARSGYPVGGDHGAYDGLDSAARYLHALPAGAVLYDFWLSWEWNFYLFDSRVYVAWLPNPAALAADLRAFGRTSPRYLAVPSWESDAEARAAARSAGFDFELVYTAFRADGSRALMVYALVPGGEG